MPQVFDADNQKFESVLNTLNITWGLQLPRTKHHYVGQHRHSGDSCAQRIVFLTRYLCDFSEAVIDNVIDEYEDAAKVIFSNWIWKPSQERGTIPSLPKAKSLLRYDITRTMDHEISKGLRNQLLENLCTLLNDEYTLTQQSQDYERTSSQVWSNPASRTTSFATAATEVSWLSQDGEKEPVIEDAGRKSTDNKRRKVSDDASERGSKHLKCGGDCVSNEQSAFTGVQADTALNPRERIYDFFRKRTKVSTAQSTKSDKVTFDPRSSPMSTDRKQGQPSSAFKLVDSFDTIASSAESVFSRTTASSFSSFECPPKESGGDEARRFLNTQECNEIFADESFASAYDAANAENVTSELSFMDLNATSPFKRSEQLPLRLAYWLRWEIYRIAQYLELTPSLLYSMVRNQIKNDGTVYEEVWKSFVSIFRERGVALPAKSDIRPWMEQSESYESPDGNSAYFSFNMIYNKSTASHLWTINLNPIMVDKSNRIHRQYGPDRHVMGYVNYFDQSSLPHWVSRCKGFQQDKFFEQIVKWLTTTTHHLAGQEWRLFYLEPDKNKTKRKTDEAPRLKLNFFAVRGVDYARLTQSSQRPHHTISITKFVNWHLQLSENLHSTDLKLFSRFGLGLSKTRATMVLEPSQIRDVADIQPRAGGLGISEATTEDISDSMNDGCSLMSKHMASLIWSVCGDATSDIPSAFQGRIGGAKGLWIVDYRQNLTSSDAENVWIAISESQLKIKPHPARRLDADDSQRTFEVVKWSNPCVPSHLNMQLINILVDRGVPRPVLQQLVLNDMNEYIEASRGAMRDPRLLQAWLQDYHPADRQGQPYSFDHGLPEVREAEACFLVQSGFDAKNCKHLRDTIISLITQKLDTYVEKLRIAVPHSTSVFCVADPYQVLEEDEVHLGFSTNWENPRTGLKDHALDGIDVLVARNPAALASDIQKRKAVFKPELRYFKDVIVFPTKGTAPLASLLSGGDYDGDTVTVIWDPSLVDTFCNVKKPPLPTQTRCGLEKVSRSLLDIMPDGTISEKDIDAFLTRCVLFNAQPSRLGTCTNEHEKLIYSGAKLSDQGSVLLATLAGYLVDASKQGYELTSTEWFKLRKSAQNGRKILPLAYKNGENLPRRGVSGECVNIIDYLKFDVAAARKESILVEFESLLPEASNYDKSLTLHFVKHDAKSRDIANTERHHSMAVLGDLKANLEKVMDEWMKRSVRRQRSNERHDFSTDVRFISAKIQEIKPLKRDCQVYRDFLRDEEESASVRGGSSKGTRWSLLRASTMYKLHGKKKITWWAVGDELGRIKAQSLGPTRELNPAMHHLLKADTKLITRIVEEFVESDEEDVE